MRGTVNLQPPHSISIIRETGQHCLPVFQKNEQGSKRFNAPIAIFYKFATFKLTFSNRIIKIKDT